MNAEKFNVRYLAELARIKLEPAEIATFESQLGHVLEHVEKLNQLDVSQVEPTAHSFPIYNIFVRTKPGPASNGKPRWQTPRVRLKDYSS